MKTYKNLPIPKNNIWERTTWRSYTPNWLKKFIDGITNILKWSPLLYKDKNWDSTYIYNILEFKLLQQRNYLVKNNRHTSIPETNRDITICLNLIQRIKTEYYLDEHFNYYNINISSEPVDDNHKFYTIKSEITWENLDEFFNKYPKQYKNVLKKYYNSINKNNDPDTKLSIARYISQENETKAKNLLFKILNERIGYWWD
jgi:hypothetical protein